MDDRSSRSSYQQSADGYHSNPAIGIPIRPSSSIAIGIPFPNTTAQVHQPRPFNPPRNQTPPQSPRYDCKKLSCSGEECDPKILSIFVMICLLIFWVIYTCTTIFLAPNDPRIEVESMVVSPFNVSATTSISPLMITAQWDVGLLIRNPNKQIKLKYRQIEISVFYKTEFLSGTVLKPFYQDGKNQTLLKASSGVLDKKLSDDGVSSSLAEDMKNGSVEFNIYLKSRMSTNIGVYYWRIVVSCPNVRVKFSSNTTTTSTEGKMFGGSTRCKLTEEYDSA